ncbi:MAG: hypothetical protein KTR30_36045 [Saprospiraceae bacterium]|nr:hypothetical protein [Saprospiraceae bacterium]
MNTPEEELQKLLEEYQTLLQAEKYLVSLQKQIQKEEENIEFWENAVEEDYRGIERLDSFSVKGLFNKFIGDKNDNQNLERQQYLEAVLALKEAYKSYELLQFEAKILVDKIKMLPHKQRRIAKLIKEREDRLEDHQKKEEWGTFFSELDEATRLAQEIREAQRIGKECTAKVKYVLELLGYAEELREWYPRFRSPDYTEEKSAIDRATEEFYHLKIWLRKFETEVEDIYLHQKISLISRASKFESFVEVYHNYLINDWIIRSRISSVISMMESLRDEIQKLAQAVDEKDRLVKEKIQALRARKQELILNELS